jgi:hypothetical protein
MANQIATAPILHIKQNITPISINFIAVLIFIAIFTGCVIAMQYTTTLGEWDLYSVAAGILDAATNGKGLNSSLHYDRNFGFGYLAAIQAFVDDATLRDPDRLMVFINRLGVAFLVPGLLLFWAALTMIRGSTVATVAVVLFAFSPMTLEMATSGHQAQIAFTFLAAAAVCVFAPLSGWRMALAHLAAFLLLTAGMTVRAEIFLAFPWLVLSRTSLHSWSECRRSFCLYAIAPAAALIAVLLLKYEFIVPIADSATPSVQQYFVQFYEWDNLLPGLVYLAVGCGIATVAVAFLAGIRLLFGGNAWPGVGNRLEALLAPVALIVTPLVFFLPNPAPPRHFMLTLAGLTIVIGIAIDRARGLHRHTIVLSLLCMIAGNQILSEAVRPWLLRANDARSPYLPIPEQYRTMTHATVGYSWQRHNALLARRRERDIFAQRLLTSCDRDTLVTSDEDRQIVVRLFTPRIPVDAERMRLGKFLGTIMVRGNRRFVVLEKGAGWPDDAIATVLADPALDSYKLVADPSTLSLYDHAVIPPDRQARFGCKPD